MAFLVCAYHSGNRYWQDRFDTRRLADRNAERFKDHVDEPARKSKEDVCVT